MTAKAIIKIRLDSVFCEGIEKLLKRQRWLAIESVEEFVAWATRRRYEDLLLLEALELKVRK